MPRYAITERAGPFVAGFRNTGVGTVLELSERQATHELRLGTLTALPVTVAPEGEGAQVGPTAEAPSPEDDTATTAAQTRKAKRSAS